MPTKADTHPGPQILALREAKGWTRYRLAKEAGVSANDLDQIEREDRMPSFETARRIAAALGCSLDALLP